MMKTKVEILDWSDKYNGARYVMFFAESNVFLKEAKKVATLVKYAERNGYEIISK